MSAFQTYIGSAFASYPIRWIETPSLVDRAVQSEKPTVEKAYDPDAGKPKSAFGDVLDLSQDAQKIYEAKSDDKIADKGIDKSADKKTDDKAVADNSIKLESDAKSEESSEKLAASKSQPGQTELTPEEDKQVKELKARDQEVRTHEAAHVAAGGPYVTGGPSYTYQTGPDGKKYAIGGEVGIDTSEVSGDPQATIQKMQTVAAAATAPAEPSGQDMKVAAAARQKELQARAALAQQDNSALAGNEKAGNEKSESQESQKVAESPQTVAKSESQSSTAAATELFEADADQTVSNSKPLAAQAFAAGAVRSSRQSSAYQAQSLMSLSSAPKSTFSAFV